MRTSFSNPPSLVVNYIHGHLALRTYLVAIVKIYHNPCARFTSHYRLLCNDHQMPAVVSFFIQRNQSLPVRPDVKIKSSQMFPSFYLKSTLFQNSSQSHQIFELLLYEDLFPRLFTNRPIWSHWCRQRPTGSVTRLGNLLHYGQHFKACGQQLFCPNCPHFGNFLKVSKSFIFIGKSFLGNFYRHLVTFYCSHCPQVQIVCLIICRN